MKIIVPHATKVISSSQQDRTFENRLLPQQAFRKAQSLDT